MPVVSGCDTAQVPLGPFKVTWIAAGQGTNIARPGAAPTSPVAWKSERIRSALESVE